MSLQRIKLWDLPTRVFHWLLAILVAAAVITANIGGNAIDWHGRIGIAIVGLLAFRIVWGFVGPHPARFISFWPRPKAIRAYLQGQWNGIGHNPLGALSVIALLILITVQIATGLFSNDDIAFTGPLFGLVSKAMSDQLTGVHKLAINILLALIALHLIAIAFYALVKKENLVRPMITGWKEVKRDAAQNLPPLAGARWVAIVFAILVGIAAAYASSGVWLPSQTQTSVPATPASQDW